MGCREVTETTTSKVYSCDVCGRGNLWNFRTCRFCLRVVCGSCGVPLEDSEYPSISCQSCFDAGELSRQDLKEENERHESSVERIMSGWREVALEKFKQASSSQSPSHTQNNQPK